MYSYFVFLNSILLAELKDYQHKVVGNVACLQI